VCAIQTPAPRAQESETPANELLEDNPSERLDAGTQKAASGVDPWLATVGSLHGTENTRYAITEMRRLRELLVQLAQVAGNLEPIAHTCHQQQRTATGGIDVNGYIP
jgi:hypothetical protein